MTSQQDPITRAADAAQRIEDARAAMSSARTDRRAALTEARETMSAQDIADALGLSRARVYAILAGRD